MTAFQTFRNQFHFNPELVDCVAVEREGFVEQNGLLVPEAPELVRVLNDESVFGVELNACQIESRTGPQKPEDLLWVLQINEKCLQQKAATLGLEVRYAELAPETIPLEYYPDPQGRNRLIWESLTNEQHLAASRVAGMHVHVGMKNHDMALRVYNGVRQKWREYAAMADQSGGERLSIYAEMAQYWKPQPVVSWEALHQYGLYMGFAHDPRACYWLIRISCHGTIEFRMFGSVPNAEQVNEIAQQCVADCEKFM